MAEDQFWQPQCPRRIGDRPFTYCYPDLQTSRDFCLDLSYSSHRLPSARTASGIFTPKIFAKHLNCYEYLRRVGNTHFVAERAKSGLVAKRVKDWPYSYA